jgi:hypothetical protein
VSAAQSFCQLWVDLDGGDVRVIAGEHRGGQARAGADLQHAVAEADVGQDPGEQLLLDGAPPP